MYGNYEYGSVPYGDIATIVIIIIDERSLEIIFFSDRKIYNFISPEKENLFTSNSRESVFLSNKRISTFISEKK